MKLLFLQISDIHWQAGQEEPERFRIAARGLPAHFVKDIDAVLFMYGGDFAYSGKAEEYDQVWEQLARFEDSVKSEFGNAPKYYSVGVPGNHDCDFGEDQSARDTLLQTVNRTHPPFQGSITEVLLKPQAAFFEFLDVLTGLERESLWNKVDQRLAWKHIYEIKGERLQINCFNSAWLSRKREQQGSLAIPTDKIPVVTNTEVALEISLLHHPLTWLEASNSNAARKRLLEVSDLIFTGHEHLSAKLQTELQLSGNSSIFEAMPFLNSDAETEGFSALYIDTQLKEQVQIEFIWNENQFVPYQHGSKIEPQQAVLQLGFPTNRYRKNRKWEFTKDFKAFLESPELDLARADRAEVRLPDIFTCPDLRELRAEANYEKSSTISGDIALTRLMEFEAAFLIGPDDCGKTAIAKMLTMQLRSEGLLPVYISAKDIQANPNSFKTLISANVDAQYGENESERFLNAPLTDKALIIDDFQLAHDSIRRNHELLDLSKKFCSRIMIFSIDTELGPADFGMFLVRPGPKIHVIHIPPFTFDRRASLIEKWLKLSPTYGRDPEVDMRKESECHQMVNTIVGRNYIQPFAPYILAVLQSSEAGQEVDLTASTHGHLYEIFIKTALSRRRTQTNYNVITAFVATLAIEAFENELEWFGMDFIRHAYDRFERETDLARDVQSLVDDLVNVKLLTKRSGEYAFREKYIYYYFIAFYLKDRIRDSKSADIIRECASKAWVQDYANVLLFLAHLSKDRFIVDTVLSAARGMFSDVEPARLEGDLSIFTDAPNEHLELSEDKEVEKTTRLQEQENVAEETQFVHVPYSLRRNATVDEVGLIGQLAAALKTLQILGQLLKNFPANFDPAQKVEIVNSCIDLGLRSLQHYFNFAEAGTTDMLRQFTSMIKAQSPDINLSQATTKANTIIGNLCHLASFGVIKRISYAIGSSELSKTYTKVFSNDKRPSRLLVEASMNLDRLGDFPERAILSFAKDQESNYFALRILRHLVLRHFRLFQRDFRLRQRIGEKIGISYRRTIVKAGDKLIGEQPPRHEPS